MEKMHHHAAGIDIGSRKVFVGLENSPVRWFETFTSDLETLKDLFTGAQSNYCCYGGNGSLLVCAL